MIRSDIDHLLDPVSSLAVLRRRAIEIGGDLANFLDAAALEFAGSKTALVIGNGPSTRNLDFKALSFTPIVSVGMNAAYRYWYEIDFRPTHYTCMDDVVVRSHAKEIRELVLEGRIKKFFLRDDILEDCPDLANHKRILWYSQVKDRLDLFKTNYITTGSWAIRWMAYEGMDLIGTIGIDANYVEILPDAQRIGGEGSLQLEIRETPKENPNYFFRDYQRAGDRYNVPNSPDYLQKTGRLLHVDALKKARDDIFRIVSKCQIIDTSDISNHGIFYKMAVSSFVAMGVAGAVTSFHQKDLMSLKSNVLIALANALNPFLAHVTVLYEGDEASIGKVLSSAECDLLNELRALGRLRIHLADERPHYAKLFNILRDSSGGASLGVVANSDIVIPCQSLAAVMRQRDRGWKGLLALTRWNRTPAGFCIQGLSASPPWPTTALDQIPPEGQNPFSFDAYIATLPLELPAAFESIFIGTLGCDTALSACARAAGIAVRNPCRDIKIYHFDDKERSYSDERGKAQLLANIDALKTTLTALARHDAQLLATLAISDRLERGKAWIGHPKGIGFWHAAFRALGACWWSSLDAEPGLAVVHVDVAMADIVAGRFQAAGLLARMSVGPVYVRWRLTGCQRPAHIVEIFRESGHYEALVSAFARNQWQSFLNADLATVEEAERFHALDNFLVGRLREASGIAGRWLRRRALDDRIALVRSVGLAAEGLVKAEGPPYVLIPPNEQNWLALVYEGRIRAGDVVAGRLVLNVNGASRCAVMVCRHGDGPFEGTSHEFNLVAGSNIIELNHQFGRPQAGLRIQIGAKDANLRVDGVEFHFSRQGTIDLEDRVGSIPEDHAVASLIALDPDALGNFGHFLSCDVRTGEAATEAGLDFAIFGNRKFDAKVNVPFTFDGIFTEHSWTIGNRPKGPSPEHVESFRRELARALDLREQRGLTRNTVLYMYCGSLPHAEAIADVLERRQGVRANVNLFWLPFVDYRSSDFIDRWKPALMRCLESGKVALTVPTERLQAGLRDAFGVQLPVAPHPSTTFSDEEADRRAGEAPRSLSAVPTILFPAGLREEKGFVEGIDVANRLAADERQLRVLLRLRAVGNSSPAVRRAIETLDKRVEVEDADLDDREFAAFLERGDVIVLPYKAPDFSERTSGLLIDAIILGKPVVVVENTWLADIVRLYRNGVVVADSPAAIVAGIDKALRDFSAYSANAKRAIEPYLARNSWQRLVSTIVAEPVAPTIISASPRRLVQPIEAQNEKASPPAPPSGGAKAAHGGTQAQGQMPPAAPTAAPPPAAPAAPAVPAALGLVASVDLSGRRLGLPAALASQGQPETGALARPALSPADPRGQEAAPARAASAPPASAAADDEAGLAPRLARTAGLFGAGAVAAGVLAAAPLAGMPALLMATVSALAALGAVGFGGAAFASRQVGQRTAALEAKLESRLAALAEESRARQAEAGATAARVDEALAAERRRRAADMADLERQLGRDLAALRKDGEAAVERQLAEARTSATAALADLSSRLDALDAARRDLAAQAEVEALAARQEAERQRMADLVAEIAALRAALEAQVAALDPTAALADLSSRLDALDAARRDLAAQAEVEALAARQEAERQRLKQELEGLAERLGRLAAEQQDLARASEVAGLADQLQALARVKDEVAPLADALASMRTMLESLSKSGEALAERVQGLEPEVARTRAGLGEAEAARLAEQEALRQRLADLRAELGALNQRYGGLDDLTQRLEAGDTELRQRLERLVGDMAELSKTIEAARAAAEAAGEKAAQAEAKAQDPRVLGVLQNRATYQSFNRSLRPEHVKTLQNNWLRRLSLPATPNGLAYLADRICVLEGNLRGRLATTIEDAVLRCAVAKSIKSERVDILEIGTLFGIGGAMLHEAVRSSGREVHLTLLDPLEGYYSRNSLDIVTQQPVDESMLRANLALAQIPAEDVTLIKAFSTDPEALAAAAERRYDMLVIDGDHSYSGVAADFRLYGPLVKVGGYILFDDYGQPDWPDVKRYVDDEMPSCDWCVMVGVEWRTAVFRVISQPPQSGGQRRRAGTAVKSVSGKGRVRSS